MSSRARRVTGPAAVISFPWEEADLRHPQRPVASCTKAAPSSQLEGAEREAFARGFAQGEAAAAAAANQRGEAMLRQLAQTLDDLVRVRAEMIRHTERQMVQLALALARRIVHREVSLDHDLLIAMARVALDRLGEGARVTVRLHPEDYEATSAAQVSLGRAGVSVMADPSVGRCGCRVESDLGTLDAGVDAQIQELGRALLGEEPVMSDAA